MATCYDCIHCDVCSGIGACSYHCSDVSKCKYFKNKADLAEVCRCEKCKHFAYGVCTNDFALNLSRADDFCSYGERSDNNA